MRIAALGIFVALVAPAVRANTLSPAATTASTQASQPPVRPAATLQPPQPEASPASQPPPPETYTYRPDGRRDPFQNLLGTGSEKNIISHKSDGPAGMTLGEISIRGIMQSRGALVAMVQGPVRAGRVDERAGGGHGENQGKAPRYSHSLASSSDRSNLRTSRCFTSESGSLTSWMTMSPCGVMVLIVPSRSLSPWCTM